MHLKNKKCWLAAGMVLLAFLVGAVWRHGASVAPGKLVQSVVAGDQLVEIRETSPMHPLVWKLMGIAPKTAGEWLSKFSQEPISILRIWRGEKLLLEWIGPRYALVGFPRVDAPAFHDLNGDKVPDLAVEEFTGGAHCCFTLHLFSFGEEFSKFAQVAGEHSPVRMNDLDGDGIPELQQQDWTFQYWPGSFAASPAPDIILRWKEGRYILAPDLMRKPLPEARELEVATARLKREARESEEAGVPPEVWSKGLEMIYSGHASAAWRWMRETAGTNVLAERRLDELQALLTKSPWHKALFAGQK